MLFVKNKTVLVHVAVFLDLKEILMMDADMNVHLTQTVHLIKHVFEINAKILVLDLVDQTQSV
jgi:hypothetical protein